MGRPRWHDLPSWFLIANHDYMILPETQRFMAQRMRAHVRAQDVDHTPMVTAPRAVVEVIREAIAGLGAS
jgi:pimeloyl-ACP methyl ester carboxylesterase